MLLNPNIKIEFSTVVDVSLMTHVFGLQHSGTHKFLLAKAFIGL